jgi:hypothetical protein
MRKLFAMPSVSLSHKRALLAIAAIVLLGIAVVMWLTSRQTVTAQDGGKPSPDQLQRAKNYSPYVDRIHATSVYWGDQHLHTSFSSDAGMLGDRLGPDDAFRFARGEQLRSSTGWLSRIMPNTWD